MENNRIMNFLAVIIILFGSFKIYGQSYISAQLTANYWQHTELFGYGMGLGFEHKFTDFAIAVNYSYGYGTYHRFKKFDNINYNYWTTVLVDEDKWSSTLGLSDPFNEMKAKSDYGKQHQFSFGINKNFYKYKTNDIKFGIGLYCGIVEHFFTFTDTLVYNLNITPFYNGPLNYIPVSHQKFITYGFNGSISYEIKSSNKSYSPFISFGFGPKYSSYISMGVQMFTRLKRKYKK
jgi:hypothetical protein